MPSKHNIARGHTHVALSYLFDWVIIIAFIAIACALQYVEPPKRAFSLTDKAISFPYRKDTISIPVVFLVAVVAPAGIICFVALLITRLPAKLHAPISSQPSWRRTLWEWHAGWLGLALSIALGFFLTQTLKNMFGKNRPDFLARCNPDFVNAANFTVGGFASQTLEGTSERVTADICISKDGSGVGYKEYIDGFRSFPSGHCTIAFAGLAYLSLYLATKLSATLTHPSNHIGPALSGRERAAAPPLYLLVVVLIPVGTAVYIASTRYTDGKHEGFDVLFGSVEGLVCAWFALRMYHPALHHAAGWAWAPRANNAAFGIRIGTGSYGATHNAHGENNEGGFHRRGGSAGTELHSLNREAVV